MPVLLDQPDPSGCPGGPFDESSRYIVNHNRSPQTWSSTGSEGATPVPPVRNRGPVVELRWCASGWLEGARQVFSDTSWGCGKPVVRRCRDPTIETAQFPDAYLMSTSLVVLKPPPGPMPRVPSLLGRDILHDRSTLRLKVRPLVAAA